MVSWETMFKIKLEMTVTTIQSDSFTFVHVLSFLCIFGYSSTCKYPSSLFETKLRCFPCGSRGVDRGCEGRGVPLILKYNTGNVVLA